MPPRPNAAISGSNPMGAGASTPWRTTLRTPHDVCTIAPYRPTCGLRRYARDAGVRRPDAHERRAGDRRRCRGSAASPRCSRWISAIQAPVTIEPACEWLVGPGPRATSNEGALRGGSAVDAFSRCAPAAGPPLPSQCAWSDRVRRSRAARRPIALSLLHHVATGPQQAMLGTLTPAESAASTWRSGGLRSEDAGVNVCGELAVESRQRGADPGHQNRFVRDHRPDRCGRHG
jgi:hypothetical protein